MEIEKTIVIEPGLIPKKESIPKEISNQITLKTYFANELPKSHIVYERTYPGSIPQIQRKSLFCTELYNVKKLTKFSSSLDQNDAAIYADSLQCRVMTENEMIPYYKISGSEDKTLVFESRFESGNLCMAIKKSDAEYDLFLQNDINTRGHTQWFFFRTSNTNKNKKIFFNIQNFVLFLIVSFIGKSRFLV